MILLPVRRRDTSRGIPMHIRTFQDADAAAVTALWREVFPHDPPHSAPDIVIRHKRAVQRELFFIAESDGALAGTVMAGYDGNRGWIYKLAVDPRQRRRGLGTALVRHAEAALRALDCPKINLQVRNSNAAVVAFYERLGYQVEPLVSMGKRLLVMDAVP
jgi:ribosomal protein S18 acetylase RimI-like enzyme